MSNRRKRSPSKALATPDEGGEERKTAVQVAQGNGIANGIFKEAFEEIVEEVGSLSHYVTNSFRIYKQNATQTDHQLSELRNNFSELAAFKEKQIKQAEQQIRQNKHNKDPSVLDGVKEWYTKMTGQLKEAKDKF